MAWMKSRGRYYFMNDASFETLFKSRNVDTTLHSVDPLDFLCNDCAVLT